MSEKKFQMVIENKIESMPEDCKVNPHIWNGKTWNGLIAENLYKKFNAVVFDMDGVIIDSEPVWIEIEDEMFRELGVMMGREDRSRYIGLKIENMWQEIITLYKLDSSVTTEDLSALERMRFRGALKGGNTEAQERGASEGLLSDYNLQDSSTEERNYLVNSSTKVGIYLFNGVSSVLDMLLSKGIKCAIASSSTLLEINIVLKKFDLEEYFCAFAGGDEVREGKPHPEVYLLAAERLGVMAEDCLAVEDSVNGLKSARAAGMKCVWFKGALNASGNGDVHMDEVYIKSFEGVYDFAVDTMEELEELLTRRMNYAGI